MGSAISLARNVAAVRRSGDDASPPVPFVPRGADNSTMYQWNKRSDTAYQLQAFGSVGTLFSIVHRTSTAVSQVEWELCREQVGVPETEWTPIRSHLALDIWNAPNPYYTRQEFVEAGQQHLDLVGEAWPLVARSPAMRSLPLELWLARPDRMMPVPSTKNFLNGYVYTGPDGERVPLALNDVMQLRMPNPMDPYRGMGPAQSVLVDLDSSKYSAEWNRNFFLNSADPGGIIEIAPDIHLSDDAWKEMNERWAEQHKGVGNAHRVAIIEHGKWVQSGFSMRDMQFAELRNVSRDVIREAFGFPKFAAGDVQDVNRAAAEAQADWFAEYLTVPRCDRWKGMLNNDFLPMFGTTTQGLKFRYTSPVKGDKAAEQAADDAHAASQATTAKTYIVDCGFTAESVQEALNLPKELVWKKPEPVPAALAAAPAGAPPDGRPAIGAAPAAAPGVAPGAPAPAALDMVERVLMAMVEMARRQESVMLALVRERAQQPARAVAAITGAPGGPPGDDAPAEGRPFLHGGHGDCSGGA